MDDSRSEKGKRKKTPPSRPPQPRAMPVVKNLPSSVKKHFEQLSDLLPQYVRWFYFEDKKWAPFCGLDSLRIEKCYRRLPTEASNAMLPDLYETCTVRGGLYDVDVVEKVCKPIYWKAEPLKICRGTWFKGAANENSWIPINEEMARAIENSHQAIWRSMGIDPGVSYQNKMHDDGGGTASNIDSKAVLGQLQLNGCSVEWNDLTEVWMHSDGMTSKILRGMVQKIGGSTGVQLHRGYHTESCETDCPADVTHLVFVIHGIGQLMHNSINDCCHMLRCGSKQMADKHFQKESKEGRVEFVPVEWRSSLKLDEGVIDLVTPHTVRGVRNVINTSMMDIMYYTSPFYREEIIACVKNELNKLYQLFLSRNPSFKEHGNVSIIAHSLGSVIVYDIMERWDLKLRDVESSSQNRFVTDSINYLNSMEECRSSQSADSGSKENPIYVELAQTQRKLEELDFQLQHQMSSSEEGQSSACVLNFKVVNCFLLGSPLAVFFTLRGFRPGEETEKAVVPQIVCKKLFNIYDQCDPVAYRLEPLFRERYSTIEPVHIKNHLESSHAYDEPEQPLQPDSSGGTGNWLVYALLGRPQGGNAAAENIEEGLPQNLDVPDEVETAEAKGWFSRIFSRSAKKDTKDVEMDDKSDEECERNSKNKREIHVPAASNVWPPISRWDLFQYVHPKLL